MRRRAETCGDSEGQTDRADCRGGFKQCFFYGYTVKRANQHGTAEKQKRISRGNGNDLQQHIVADSAAKTRDVFSFFKYGSQACYKHGERRRL